MVSADQDSRRPGTVWVLDLAEPPLRVAPAWPADFRRLGADDRPGLAHALGEAQTEAFAARLKTGRWGYAAWSGNALAAYGWVSFDEELVGEQRLRLRLAAGEAYVWDCVTLPTYRRQHFYSALLSHMAADLRTQGLRRVWIGADAANVPSQRGMERAGFRIVGDLAVARVLALRLQWLYGRPGVPPALVAEARRVFFGLRDSAWLVAAGKRPWAWSAPSNDAHTQG